MRILEEKINYSFKNRTLLTTALTHPSYSAEKRGINNQRLEFLGDAVLEAVISNYIFENFSDLDEGKMTRLRASIVSEAPLFEAAKSINLFDYILLGSGESASGGKNKPSVLSDALEALFAAVYLDGGFDEAKRVILAVLKQVIDDPTLRPYDYKTELQEFLFKDGEVKVEYITESVSHQGSNFLFASSVFCNGKLLGTGEGTSKKRAEQDAAKNALVNTL